MAAHPRPIYRLTLDGRDITPTVDPRLIGLSLTECRGDEADRLDLSLSDHDGLLDIPGKGVELSLAIGWADTGLVDKGTFVVDETEHTGAPDMLTIRARSAELRQSLRVRAEHSYHRTTVGAIVGTIAGRNQLTPRVDPALAALPVEHIDQTGESDVNFLTRLAKQHDAVCTVKRDRLLFLPINGTTTSGGQPLQAVAITRASGDNHRYHTSDRDAYSGVRAYWHDPGKAKRRGVLVGASGNAKRLRETYANATDALRAAKAEYQRVKRGASTLELTLALGVPLLGPQVPVSVAGFKPQIDGTSWLTVKTTHTMGDAGFHTRVELENADAPAPGANYTPDDDAD